MKQKKSVVFLVILISTVLIISSSTFAWSSHGKMTYFVANNIDWLEKYNSITITEYHYSDIDTEPYNPDFKILYKEGYIGEQTSALEILSIYADEPDWDMDENLKLSSFQKIIGGSSGWRHQYYITFFGIIRIGNAPKRSQYFYDLALKAFDKDDYYWGFRFFARALHYAEDVSQPLHAFPLPISVILKNIFNINGLVKIGENHHYTFEDYQGTQIEINRSDYIDVLKTTETMDVNSINRLAVLNAFKSKKDCNKIFDIQQKFYGEGINNKEGFSINKDDYKVLKDNEYQEEYDNIIKSHLINFAITVNTALELLHNDLLKMGVFN
ncbi:MAG TPA: hypothetical protein PLK48_00380 [Caldisericia bacterium]|nr:hypothetical protein [Caldisericia bacterium]HPP44065.1 hypothetical protein [Caldisericia bacterium]